MTAGMAPSQSAMSANGSIMPNPRSIYLGNVEPQTSYEELIDHIAGGNLDSVRILPEKQCAFVTFLSPMAAKIFLEDITAHGMTIRNRQLKANWGKVTPVPADVERHVLQGATRAVFVGGTTDSMTEEFFRTDFERFGNVDTVKVLPDKKVAFIHFTSINFAIKAVAQLRTEERFKGHKIDYGRDRCNRMPRRSGGGLPPGAVGAIIDLPDGNAPAFRTVYLGNMDPDTMPDELCAIVRGGPIDSIKMIPDKQHAFVAFVTADGASAFHASCATSPPVVRGRTLKVGWGKESPLPSEVAMLVRQGATRNVYVGQIDDTVTPERLRQDFAPFGTLESVAIVREKKCAFVAFLSIQAAAKAIQTLKSDPTYTHFKLNYGKDNCARPPRTPGGPSGSSSNGLGTNGHVGVNGSNGANGHYAPPYSASVVSARESAPNGLGMNGTNAGPNGIFGNSYYYQSDSPSFGSAYSSRAPSPPPQFGGVGANGMSSGSTAMSQPQQQHQAPLHHPQHHQAAALVAGGQYGAAAFSTGLFGSSSSPTLLTSALSSGGASGYLPSSMAGSTGASSPSSAAFSFSSYLSHAGATAGGTASSGAAVSGTFGNSYGGAFAIERPSSGLGLAASDANASGTPSGAPSPVSMLAYGHSAFSMSNGYGSSGGLFSGIGGSSSGNSEYGIFGQSLGSSGLSAALPSMATATQQPQGQSAFGSYDASYGGSYY